MHPSRLIRILLAVALLATAGVLMQGYTTDDTYIHLRYAQNLIDRGEFSFNPGQQSYGATSPLWIFILAIFLKLGLAPFTAAWLAGVLSGLLLLLLLDAMLERMTFPTGWKPAILLLAAGDVWFVRWTFSGMETPLATALLLLLLWPLVSGRGPERAALWPRYLAWGVAAGLAGLVRPEFVILAPLALPWLLGFEYARAGRRGGARLFRPLLAALSGWMLVLGPWFCYAYLTFGRVTPGTAAAKSSGMLPSPTAMGEYLFMGIKPLATTQGLLWVGLVILGMRFVIRKNRNMSTLWTELGRADDASAGGGRTTHAPGQDSRGALDSWGAWDSWAVRGPLFLVGIALTWSLVLLGGYAVKQVWMISRYISPLAPVLLLALGVMAAWLTDGQSQEGRGHRAEGDRAEGRWASRGVLLGVVLLTLLGNAWIFGDRVVPHARKFPAGVRACYLGMGEWLSRNTEPDAVVAALDIGAVGYASERRVLDLMGLVSPEILAVGAEMGFPEMVASGAWVHVPEATSGRTADYFVDRAEGPPRWVDRVVDGVRFELLDTCILEGVGLRESQPWTVALYRLVSVESRVSDSAGG